MKNNRIKIIKAHWSNDEIMIAKYKYFIKNSILTLELLNTSFNSSFSDNTRFNNFMSCKGNILYLSRKRAIWFLLHLHSIFIKVKHS